MINAPKLYKQMIKTGQDKAKILMKINDYMDMIERGKSIGLITVYGRVYVKSICNK